MIIWCPIAAIVENFKNGNKKISKNKKIKHKN